MTSGDLLLLGGQTFFKAKDQVCRFESYRMGNKCGYAQFYKYDTTAYISGSTEPNFFKPCQSKQNNSNARVISLGFVRKISFLISRFWKSKNTGTFSYYSVLGHLWFWCFERNFAWFNFIFGLPCGLARSLFGPSLVLVICEDFFLFLFILLVSSLYLLGH